LSFSALLQQYEHHEGLHQLVSGCRENNAGQLYLHGLSGSSASVLAGIAASQTENSFLFILDDREAAAYFFDDLQQLFPTENILFFPSSYKRSAKYRQKDSAGTILRTKTLNQISSGQKAVIVSYPEAISEKVISTKHLGENTLSIKKGENLSIDFVNEVMVTYGFELVDFVYEPGQYSIRGSIVDIYSFAAESPFRIDFFGDEVDSIRLFDIETQLSGEKIQSADVVPDLLQISIEERNISFLDYIPEKSIVWTKNTEIVSSTIHEIFESSMASDSKDGKEESHQTSGLLAGFEFKEGLKKKLVVEYGVQNVKMPTRINFNTKPQPVFHKNFEFLAADLNQKSEQGYHIYILSENQKQFARLREIFEATNHNVSFEEINGVLHEGYIENDAKVCVYTDHEIFERYHKFKVNTRFTRKDSITLKELTDLHPGDYVVHIDHGIGKFGGLEKIEVNGKMQETIRLVYRDNDVLYVSIHSLHRISKYKSKDGDAPKIYKLGTGAWQKLKQTTKSKVKDIARDLIALYAKRKSEKGFTFSPDSYLQQELEASFIYEDTPDQESATRLVKKGMESEHPMDVLVCGDVGFGKTEVAIRAAFKAVNDSKQVAVLVPTTILALQHYQTFKERLKDFPCTVDYISRLKKPFEQKKTLASLKEGKLDILIGTHRLVGKDIGFKDLGLLIIDEEQKFGVTVKEKLKKLKVNVDTLTLTATPIPRTLQFSLMGARDLSIINTPPPNRHPILTELFTFNNEIITEAIDYEVSRGGQVFFIHNRVQSIAEIELLINKLLPKVKTLVAHGQMEGKHLEKIMLEFIAGDYDVLIATTIIESGLDIPNANTIIINNAHNFGLSDLHQLRGRVGRSNKKAFCYLLAPPLTAVTAEARRRLKAIEEFSELGSGFNIAMQDLDIRGAGNLLGGEQSGFISDIGFETYQRILNEAMQELKDSEFQNLFETETPESSGDSKDEIFVTDCNIDTDLEVLFPEDYIRNVSERINLYRELDNIENEEHLQEFGIRLRDRFGAIPPQTLELFNVVRLRWLAFRLGVEKIILKRETLSMYFISNQTSPFYQSETFARILQFVQKKPAYFKMKEAKEKLNLTVDNIKNLSEAIQLFKKMLGRNQD